MCAPPPSPDLQTALARAAAFGLSPEVRFAAQSGEEAIVFLLDQVKTCQLPRRVTVTAGQAEILVADAAGGRLLRLISVGDTAQAHAFADLLGNPLNARSDTDADQVAACLRAILPDTAALVVTTARLDSAEGHTGSGLVPAQVLQALGFVPADSDPAAKLDDLLCAAEDVLIALYTGRDDTRLFRPEAALPDPLLACLDRLLAEPGGLIDLVTPDDILFLTGIADLPHGIGVMSTPDGPAALIFDAGAGAELAAFWAELPLAP